MFVNTKHKEALDLLKAGKIEDAIQVYTDILSEIGDHPDVLSDRGVAYLHENKRDACIEDLLKAKSLEPNNAYRHASLAFARTHFKDFDNAIKDYEKAIELDPEDAVAYNNLGLLLEQKGYQQQAQERFKRADQLSKQEDHLIEMMEGMEPQNEDKKDSKIQKTQPKQSESKKEFKKIFTSRKQFREFIRFVTNGFKIK